MIARATGFLGGLALIVAVLVLLVPSPATPQYGYTPAPAKTHTLGKSTSKKTDPYKRYAYRVRFGSADAAGFSGVSSYFGLPGKRIVSLDSGETRSPDFHEWANGVNDTSMKITARTLLIVQVDSSGHAQSGTQYVLCWPRQYQSAAGSAKNQYFVSVLRLECGTATQTYTPPSPPSY